MPKNLGQADGRGVYVWATDTSPPGRPTIRRWTGANISCSPREWDFAYHGVVTNCERCYLVLFRNSGSSSHQFVLVPPSELCQVNR